MKDAATDAATDAMRQPEDGWLVRAVTGLLSADDSDWAEAVLAELPHLPPRRRTLWALGGLWSLLWRRPATWLIRVLALVSMAWQGLWLWASIGVLTDDAPDLRWPYSLYVVLAQAAVLLTFAVMLIRPVAGVVLALPALVVYGGVMWESARINDGSPPPAVAIFAGFPAVFLAAIALLAILKRTAVASRAAGNR